MASKNERCSGIVWDGWHKSECRNTGRLEHDGKRWCKVHHPPTVKAKRKARSEARRAGEQRRQEASALAAAKRRIAELPQVPDADLLAECQRRGWTVTRG